MRPPVGFPEYGTARWRIFGGWMRGAPKRTRGRGSVLSSPSRHRTSVVPGSTGHSE